MANRWKSREIWQWIMGAGEERLFARPYARLRRLDRFTFSVLQNVSFHLKLPPFSIVLSILPLPSLVSHTKSTKPLIPKQKKKSELAKDRFLDFYRLSTEFINALAWHFPSTAGHWMPACVFRCLTPDFCLCKTIPNIWLSKACLSMERWGDQTIIGLRSVWLLT